MGKTYFEDCCLGEKMKTQGRTITETDIVMFAALTGDWLPLHTDAEYARKSPFGERIAHGMLVLIAGSALLLRGDEHALLPESTVALYGIDKVRFRKPTRIGDTIHTESEVVRMTEVDQGRGEVTVKCSIKNQRSETVAVFTIKAVVGRRAGG